MELLGKPIAVGYTDTAVRPESLIPYGGALFGGDGHKDTNRYDHDQLGRSMFASQVDWHSTNNVRAVPGKRGQ